MERKLRVAKVAVVMGSIPLVIWGYISGPDRPATGAPGELTCAQALCHVAAGPPNGGGSITVTFPAGMVYTPGVKQHVVFSLTHPTARVWGFQATARVANAATTNAGSFASSDRTTAVLCTSSASDINGTFRDFGPSQVCPADKPLAFIEHASPKPLTQTFEFDYTPPATNVGDIRIYIAANAANNNQHEDGDQIYSTFVTLTPVATGAPAIEFSGVQNGASFESGFAPNSWMTIKGANLATTTKTDWGGAIVDGRLPTELDGVTVSVGGRPAYINYISPTQINVLAPDVGIGSLQVSVRNSAGTSAAASANSGRFMPAFFMWPNRQAVATHHPDGSYAVKNGTFAGATTTPAKPGDVIILWGTGFGPTNRAAPVGSVTLPGVPYSVENDVTVTVGGAPARVIGAALSNGFVGLYQIAIEVPASAPNGDLPVVATVSGAQSPAGVVLAVQK
jgi:uncharacterized protein (TIGR03437 family)